MDLPNQEGVSVETEPGSQEEGGAEVPHTDTDADLQDVREECLQYAGRMQPASSREDRMDPINTKREPAAVSSAEEEGELPHAEIEYTSCPDIKVERLDCRSAVHQSEDSKPIKEEPREERKVTENSDASDIKGFIERIYIEYKREYKKTPAKSDFNQRAILKGKKKRVFPCEQCNAVFPKKNQLEIHSNVHTGEKPFSCSKCSSVFSQKSNWKTHMLAHDGVKPFACPHCSAAFTRKMCLKTHILSHTGERPFACSQCSSAFTHESTLKTHILTHYGLKPFSCGQCRTAFSRKTGLDRHLLTHSGEKPFPCDQCSSAFTRKSSLQTHMLSHSGVKPFACYLCSFTCSVGISLKRHLLTHTGEKPFPCPLCDYMCSQKSRLKNHIRRHSEKSHEAKLEELRGREVSSSAPQAEVADSEAGMSVLTKKQIAFEN